MNEIELINAIIREVESLDNEQFKILSKDVNKVYNTRIKKVGDFRVLLLNNDIEEFLNYNFYNITTELNDYEVLKND